MVRSLFALGAIVAALCPHGGDAHGYTSDPPTRGSYCKSGGSGSAGCVNLASTGQSEAIYTPQGVCYQDRQGNYLEDYMKTMPDGKICSAGGAFPGLDLAATSWKAKPVTLKSGNKMDIQYTFTAFHPTDHIAYYITKQGASNSSPINKSDLTLLGRFDDVSRTGQVTHTVTVPSGISGTHTIVTFWLVSTSHGTGENFISCSDVEISGGSSSPDPAPQPDPEPTPEEPEVPVSPTLPPTPTEIPGHEGEECWEEPDTPASGDNNNDDDDDDEDDDNNGGDNNGGKYPAWVMGTVYSGGDIVTGSDGLAYRCKPFPYSGWCGQADAYKPSSGFAWADAWEKI